MRKKISFILICVCIVIASAELASAVTGNAEITVTDKSGNRLPGTSISLISKETGQTVVQTETDQSGTAVVPLEEGRYTIEVGKKKTRTDITVTAGQTSSVSVSVPGGTAPPFEIPPIGIFTYGDEDADDIPVTSSVDRITDTINGVVRPTDVRESDPNDLNTRFDFELNWNNQSGTFATGLGRAGAFHPFIKGSIGRADISFTSRNLANPSTSSKFEGDGVTYGIGGGALIGGDAPIFGGGGYLFTGFYDVGLTRDKPVQVPPGAFVTKDEVEISYWRHQIRLFAGTRVGPFYPYGGAMIERRRVEINGTTEADFSQVAGFPVLRSIEFTNKLKDNSTEALVGFGIHQGRLLVGLEASFGNGYRNFLLQAGIGF